MCKHTARVSQIHDAVGEPVFHNRYSYANSNPINRADPSGLCPPLVNPLGDKYEADARSCYQMVNNLRINLNINITWQENSLPPLTCVPELVQRVANQSQSINQRWTTNEVRAIYNAFLIFDKAHTTFQFFADSAPQYGISFPYDYIWPRQQPVTFEKKRYIQENDQTSFGIHLYDDNKIILSAVRWGEANPNMTLQSRSWLALHEFSHFFTKDRIRQRQPSAYLFALDSLANTSFERYGARGSATQYSTPGAPGRAQPSFNEEYLTEAVTGTIWNYGYETVLNYDSSAGGWTGAIGQPTVITVNNIDFTLKNVRNIRGLERFVLFNIIAPPISN